jgi:membrane protein
VRPGHERARVPRAKGERTRLTARALASLDGYQRRHPSLAVLVGVVRKFIDDRASSLAALVAYYAFFSLFPLLLVLVSTLGFALEDNPSLEDEILDSAFGRIPVIGAQLRNDVEPLTGSTAALVVGLAGALWAGLGVTLALSRAFDVVWDVPRLEQRGGMRARLYGLIVLTVLGGAVVASTVAGGVAAAGGIGLGAESAAALAGSFVVNSAVLLAVFWLLTGPARPLRSLLPGATVAGVGLLALQAVGGWYVDRTVTGAGDTYGTFALVIGLLSWFWLVAHLLLLAAELNVVLRRRLWPRALAGELGPADRRALQRSAEACRRDRRQQIEVSFTDEDR